MILSIPLTFNLSLYFVKVETNCNHNTVCADDEGTPSCGPFQIKEAYWIDCGRPGDSKLSNNKEALLCLQERFEDANGVNGVIKSCKFDGQTIQ